jgi:hypothetical protein
MLPKSTPEVAGAEDELGPEAQPVPLAA